MGNECCEVPVSELRFLEYVCPACVKAMVDYHDYNPGGD